MTLLRHLFSYLRLHSNLEKFSEVLFHQLYVYVKNKPLSTCSRPLPVGKSLIYTNKTHFKNKSFALGFTLKARVFVTRKIAH